MRHLGTAALQWGKKQPQEAPKAPLGQQREVSPPSPTRGIPSSLGEFEQGSSHPATDGVARERAQNESPHFQEGRRMVLPRTEGAGDFSR